MLAPELPDVTPQCTQLLWSPVVVICDPKLPKSQLLVTKATGCTVGSHPVTLERAKRAKTDFRKNRVGPTRFRPGFETQNHQFFRQKGNLTHTETSQITTTGDQSNWVHCGVTPGDSRASKACKNRFSEKPGRPDPAPTRSGPLFWGCTP